MDSNNQIIFPGRVVSNEDPYVLGRVRAFPYTSQDIKAMAEGKGLTIQGDDIPENEKWRDKDPFVFIPLLPFFVYQVPQVGEYVHLVYYDKSYAKQSKNQFYIQGPFSEPMSTGRQDFRTTESILAQGQRYQMGLQLKNFDGTYKTPSNNEGLYPNVTDVSVLGRGSADLILKRDNLKGEDTALLRAGKSNNIQPHTEPVINNNRAFLQLSNFQQSTTLAEPTTYSKEVTPVLLIKQVVEWNISNPENIVNHFTGDITLYNVTQTSDNPINTNTISLDTDLTSQTTIVYKQYFCAKSKNDVITQINNFIKGLNDGSITGVNSNCGNNEGSQDYTANSQFPFYYRPSKNTYNSMTQLGGVTDVIARKNLLDFNKQINLQNSNPTTGYGLVWSKDLMGIQKDTIQETITPTNIIPNQPISYAALGSQKVYLLSQDSVIPTRGVKVNFENSIYGIPQTKFTEEIDAKTDAMVRGDQLLTLLNLIVKYMVSHVHAYHGVAPVPVTEDGTTVSEILQKMLDAPNTVLNQNIRIN